MTHRKPLLMLGAGDQAAAFVLGYRDNPDYEFTGFVQDADPSLAGRTLEGLPIYSVQEALALRDTHAALSCIGNPAKRRLIEKFEAAGFEFARMISPLALVDPTAVVEPGCIVNHHASLDARVHIGRHTIIARNCVIAHHVQVGACGMVSSGAMIAGGTRVGDGCFIGMGAVVKDHLTIGDGATVGLGAVVVEDVPPGATVAGNPARPLSARDTAAIRRKPLLVLGAGDMAATYVEEFGNDPNYEIVGLVQDADAARVGEKRHGKPVLGVEEALGLSRTHAIVAAIGSAQRQALIERFEDAGFDVATLISPTAVVHGRDGIEPGCIICDLANIDPHIRIGRHTIITSGVTIAHHCRVGAFSFVASGVQFGGNCRVGDRCFIGTGAIIRDHINIGDGATVGAGAVVVKDVAPGSTVAGVPARPLVGAQPRIPLLILGAGEQAASHAENVADHPLYEVAGFVQDADPALRGTFLEGRPVYWIDEVSGWKDTHRVVCCVGSMKKRALITKFEAMGFTFATVAATTALVSPKAVLGPGCFVSHTGQVAPFAEVGPHTMIGRQTMIGHHSRVGAFSLIAGSSVIGGGARIGEGCYIGMGALILDHITIGDGATVGVGAVVIRDVPPGATVVGNPARELPPK